MSSSCFSVLLKRFHCPQRILALVSSASYGKEAVRCWIRREEHIAELLSRHTDGVLPIKRSQGKSPYRQQFAYDGNA